ncbi:MAG: TIGR02449 family protein [Methylococcales bacterium]
MTEINLPLELKYFENKLDELIEHYQYLKNENSHLKIKLTNLTQEKVELLEKAALAKARVDTMITKLKVMEPGS